MFFTKRKPGGWASRLRSHSLSFVAIGILGLWIVLYRGADPSHRAGAFCGNAIADWSGVVVTILATKYMYEKGSAESRDPHPEEWLSPVRNLLRNHSLSIFLLITGVGWVVLYLHVNSEAKWGQVVGNIVSEWTQIFGLVLLTKKLIEKGSKEGRR